MLMPDCLMYPSSIAYPRPMARRVTRKKGINWPTVYTIAGWPENRSFSVSRDLVAANAVRSVLQNLHLMATALMISPQTGHAFESSSIDRSFQGRIITQSYAASRAQGGSNPAPQRHCLRLQQV